MRQKYLQKIREFSPNQLVSEYLISCCLYYELCTSYFEDDEFDYLAKCLVEQFDKATHPHKSLINFESLKKTPSGYYLKYPSVVRSCACHIACKIPGGPMSDKSMMYVNSYVCAMMDKKPVSNATPA